MPQALSFSHFAGDPYLNMAFDEWLLARAETTPGFFAVRLYTWQPAAITFGLNQRQDKAFRADRLGHTAAIRRVTGGRAIYHDRSELTYAVALNLSRVSVPALAGTLSQTSTRIALALQEFLGRLGRPTDFVRLSSPENARPDFFHTAPCFASHARYELTEGSRKVVASAQRRLEHGLLQHGSLKLAGIAVHPALGDTQSELQPVLTDQFNYFAQLFEASLSTTFGVEFERPSLTRAESDRLAQRCESVRKNCLLRRDAIKQSMPAVSL
jgi:lipoate-protein ligase A